MFSPGSKKFMKDELSSTSTRLVVFSLVFHKIPIEDQARFIEVIQAEII
jgi:hypothetical protein